MVSWWGKHPSILSLSCLKTYPPSVAAFLSIDALTSTQNILPHDSMRFCFKISLSRYNNSFFGHDRLCIFEQIILESVLTEAQMNRKEEKNLVARPRKHIWQSIRTFAGEINRGKGIPRVPTSIKDSNIWMLQAELIHRCCKYVATSTLEASRDTLICGLYKPS